MLWRHHDNQVLGTGIVMWWKTALKGGPEIDVTTIKGRQPMPAGKKTFSEVYAEAQKAFIEKMKVEGKPSVTPPP